MNAHKGNVFGLLFLFCFGTYAVLPLICTLTRAGATEVVTVKNEVPSIPEHFPHFLSASARERLVSGKGMSVTFLMRGKRAILPGDSFRKTFSSEALLLSGEDLPFSLSPPAVRMGKVDSDKRERDCHRLCLNHSPPSAWSSSLLFLESSEKYTAST